MKISGIVIVKNEEKMIGDALDSLSFCDEIIVIDNASTDDTKQVSEKHQATVYNLSSKDFSELRNFGLSKAVSDYILYLDADERISKELASQIKETVEKNKEYSAFRLKRKNFYLGENEWPYIEKIERLFKKDKLLGWKGKLHESPEIEGKIGEISGFILHHTHRNLESMVEKTNEWSDTEALTRYNLNHPKVSWWRFPRVMITAFLDSYVRQRGFKAGIAGLVESVYQAFSIFITYAKLWEIQENKKN